MIEREIVIVGGGPAGMAAAIAAHENGAQDILLLSGTNIWGESSISVFTRGLGLIILKRSSPVLSTRTGSLKRSIILRALRSA